MSSWESKGLSDDWYTPKYVFDKMGVTFDLDVAAPIDRAFCTVPANQFITANSLYKEWNGFIWMNPPWSGRGKKEAWLNKFFEHGDGIALTPDRSSAPWWQSASLKTTAVLFVKGKIKFIKPDGTTGNWPSTGTTLFAVGDLGVKALINAERNGLGKMFANPRKIN